MTDKFIPGLYVKPPHPKAPDFVKGRISIQVQKLLDYLNQWHEGEYINLNILVSKKDPDKWFAKIDDWKPGRGSAAPDQPQGAGQKPPSARRPPSDPDAFIDDDLPW